MRWCFSWDMLILKSDRSLLVKHKGTSDIRGGGALIHKKPPHPVLNRLTDSGMWVLVGSGAPCLSAGSPWCPCGPACPRWWGSAASSCGTEDVSRSSSPGPPGSRTLPSCPAWTDVLPAGCGSVWSYLPPYGGEMNGNHTNGLALILNSYMPVLYAHSKDQTIFISLCTKFRATELRCIREHPINPKQTGEQILYLRLCLCVRGRPTWRRWRRSCARCVFAPGTLHLWERASACARPEHGTDWSGTTWTTGN